MIKPQILPHDPFDGELPFGLLAQKTSGAHQQPRRHWNQTSRAPQRLAETTQQLSGGKILAVAGQKHLVGDGGMIDARQNQICCRSLWP